MHTSFSMLPKSSLAFDAESMAKIQSDKKLRKTMLQGFGVISDCLLKVSSTNAF